MNYLVSYNHSGNTLIRYFIELLTGYPTIGHNTSCIDDRDGITLGVDRNLDPILVKRHEIIEGEITPEDTFILLLRDCNDCIKENFDTEITKYYKLIGQYGRHAGPKYIIPYNDIVKDPLAMANVILTFIKFNGMRRSNINVEYHKAKSLSVYRNSTGKPGCSEEGLRRIPAIQFTFELWSAASLTEFGVKLREYSVGQHAPFLREHAIGFTEGHRLSVRPKRDCMAVMFHINNKSFWTHLTKKEFNYVFDYKYHT